MLIVTVELLPGGFRPLGRTIASMRVSNLSNLADVSRYSVEAKEGANPLNGTPARTWCCELDGHDRRQSVWVLLAKAAAAVGEVESAPV